MACCSHTTSETVTRAVQRLCDIKSEILQVGQKEISLRKWSGGTARLRTLEETLVRSVQLVSG